MELLRPLRLDLALELEAAWHMVDFDGRAAAEAADAVAERAEAASDRSGAMLARAMALFVRIYGGDHSATIAEPEELCRAALPLEEERGDPRRLALLWSLLAYAANFRMQNDEHFVAAERALHYSRLAGDSPSGTAGLDWALILGPRPADEALRALDEIDAGRPPGASDLGRATLLAMLGRIDEAWQLAEARSDHLREVRGDSFAGDEYLAVIAQIEGDRERACRHTAKLVDGAPPGSDGVMASWRSMLARDLCYLGRFDEAEPLLQQARAGRFGPCDADARLGRRGAPPRRARRTRPGGGASSRRRCDRGDRDGQRLAPGLEQRGPRDWCSSARDGSTRRGRRSSERSPSGSESAACPSCVASASRSTRSGGRRSDHRSRDIPAHSRMPLCSLQAHLLSTLRPSRVGECRWRYTTNSSATASALSRIAIPSSSSSMVVFSGGQTITMFQRVIR